MSTKVRVYKRTDNFNEQICEKEVYEIFYAFMYYFLRKDQNPYDGAHI